MTLAAPVVPCAAATTGRVRMPSRCTAPELSSSRGMLDPATGTTCAGDAGSGSGAVPQAPSASALAARQQAASQRPTARCFAAMCAQDMGLLPSGLLGLLGTGG